MKFSLLYPNLKEDMSPPAGKDIPPVITMGQEDPFFQEQFKVLRAKVQHKVDTLNHKVIAITSAIAGEGKTVLSANLALNLASAGRKKVLLVDIDLRKSDLAPHMGVVPIPGLTEYLSGFAERRDIVRNSFISGLYITPGGKRNPAPVDLLSGERFRSFIQDSRGVFDVVILDTPPIMPVADTMNIRELVDGFVFLYRVGFTPYKMLQQAVEEIGSTKVIGVVLNGVEPHRQRYYQRYYGKYYRKPGNSQDRP